MNFNDLDSCGSSNDDQRTPKVSTSSYVAQFIIKSRCTELSMFATSFTMALLVLVMQIIAIVDQNWLYVHEPRTINKTNEKGEFLELPFAYTTGYFKVCRTFERNAINSTLDETLYSTRDFRLMCYWNPIYTNQDLSDFSFATYAIVLRLGVPTYMHIVGVLLTFLAFLASIWGHIQKNKYTIISAIFFVLGGLTVSTAVLQFVSVVDDEMHPRMRANAAGEPSKFNFNYGMAFTVSALSFLPVQLCVYIQTKLHFMRYPSALEKSRIVPGLEILVDEIRKKERFEFRQQTGTVIQSLSRSQMPVIFYCDSQHPDDHSEHQVPLTYDIESYNNSFGQNAYRYSTAFPNDIK